MSDVLVNSSFANSGRPLATRLQDRSPLDGIDAVGSIGALDRSLYPPTTVLRLRSRVYTASAWPKYEYAGRWFFLLQCFEAMFNLCDRQGFTPEQVTYCGVIGRGAKRWHLWTAMEWRT